MRKLFAVVALIPLIASAQGEPETTAAAQAPVAAQPPVVPVVHAAVPVPNDWNIGAGLTFGAGIASIGSLGGGSALAGLLGGSTSFLGVSSQPRMTVLIERRLSEQLFLGFAAGVSFNVSQSDTFTGISNRQVSVDGTVGVRRIFNPRGVVEVSWFANAGVSYSNGDNRSLGTAIDPSTGALAQNIPVTVRSQGFGVGAAAGLAFERELIAGLGLRLSSSVLGLSYSTSTFESIVAGNPTESSSHGFDGGLRFSPTIELRYAF